MKFGTNVKVILDNWNLGTNHWFRRVAFDRLSTGRTLGVFVLSAFWYVKYILDICIDFEVQLSKQTSLCRHGFYPGYYMTFFLTALYVYAGRGVCFYTFALDSVTNLNNFVLYSVVFLV